jgi:predicted dehydrogenase
MEYAFRAGGRSVEMGGGVNELTLYPNEGDPLRLSPTQVDPYAAECAYFVDAVRRGDTADRATPADAMQALAVALAARESLERGGERVAVPGSVC